MSSGWQKLKTVIAVLALVLSCAIAALLVWALGPADDAARIILVALVLMIIPLALVFNRYRKKRKGQKTIPAAERMAAKPTPQLSAPARAYDELTRSAEEAVQWLRSTRLGGEQAGGVVYRLPWFLVAGAPASGKTSLILSAGLDFHALPSQRRAEIHLVRPTRDCEWRITDSAVLLDTSGRYQTEGPDRDEWAALIETIKNCRKERPLDGLLVVASIAHLLASNDGEIEQEAKVLRARLDEVIARVRVRFPVYLIFTHADAVEGFADFFRTLSAEERAQVWGATVPLEQTANSHALFDVEFDYLSDALMRRRLSRISVPAPPNEQLRMFDFPLRFQEARRKLGLYTSTLFRPNPFSESPMLRGFYFSSSGSSSRSSSNMAPSGDAPAALAADGAAATRPVVGDALFTQDLFNDVLLRDKDIAASVQASKPRSHSLRNAALAVAAGLLVFFLIGEVASFLNNKSLIARASAVGMAADARTGAKKRRAEAKETKPSPEELADANSLREVLVELDGYDRGSRPLFYRFGLYSGNSINPRLRAVYFDLIDRWFFTPALASLKNKMQTFAPEPADSAEPASGKKDNLSEDDLDYHYDLLKVYLMLSGYKKDNQKVAEPTFLANQLAPFWNESSPDRMEHLARQQLDFYATQVSYELRGEEGDPPTHHADEEVSKGMRGRLAAYPAYKRFYKRITTQIDSQVQPITVSNILKGSGNNALNGSYAVPGSFTIEGYYRYMRDAFDSATEEMGKDDWVLGTQATAAGAQPVDVAALKERYFRDYTAHWQKFLKGLSVRPYDVNRKDDAVEALRTLGSSNSPLVLVINEVSRHTKLSVAPTGGGLTGWIRGIFSSKVSGTTEGKVVEEEFAFLHQFTSTEGDKNASAISQYRGALEELATNIAKKTPQQLKITEQAIVSGAEDDIGFTAAQAKVQNLLASFQNAAALDAAKALKEPLDNVKLMLSGGGCDDLERMWSQQLYGQAYALESGYPFAGAGSAKVTDLVRFFNFEDGEFSKFFNNRLSVFFENVDGRWQRKDSSPCQFSDEFVKYLNNALRLRDAVFPGNSKTPKVSYEIKLQPPPEGYVIVMEVDGNKIEAQGNSPAAGNFTWPAQSGNAGVKVTVKRGDAVIGDRSEAEAWGVFKAFVPNAGGNQYVLNWTVGPPASPVTVRATLTPSASNHPFQRDLFKQLHAPRSLKP
jgi:type VI secretion system protein ImpL